MRDVHCQLLLKFTLDKDKGEIDFFSYKGINMLLTLSLGPELI